MKTPGPAAVAATAVALSASLLACGGADDLDDSLGGLWEVAPEPETTIGSIPRNGEDEELYGVTDIALLADGGIVVAQQTTVSFFDADGGFRRSVGREGDGPGDFRRIQRIMPIGPDSVGVWDTGNQRFTVLGLDGGVGSTVQPQPTFGNLIPAVGVLEDRSLVLTNGLDLASIFGGGTGRQRHPLLALRYAAPSGELVDTLATLSGSELFAWVSGGGFSFRILPFGKVSAFALSSGRLYGGSGDSQEISAWIPGSSTPVAVVRWEGDPVPVTPGDRSTYEEERLAEAGEAGRQAEADRLATIEYPEHMPPFSGLLTDDADRLWVREGSAGSDGTWSWHVFGPEDARLARVRLSTAFRLLRVQGDLIYGVHQTELGHESVRAYRIARS